MASKKAPKQDTSAQDAALAMQRVDSAKLDEEENRRRKRLFSGAAGIRAFTGSAMFRRPAGNTAGVAPGSASPGAGRPITPRAPRGGAGYMIP